MGQKNRVSVINFVANLTIEHRMLLVLVFKSALAQGILDDGEDTIFMDTDKFTKFMETVEAVTVDMQGEAMVSTEQAMEALEMGERVEKGEEGEEDKKVEEVEEEEEEEDEEEEYEEEYEDEYVDEEDDEHDEHEYEGETEEEVKYEKVVSFEGDDDITPIDTITESQSVESSTTVSSTTQPSPQDLLAGGFRFLSGLAQTLSSPEATQKLVSSMVERDEKTGRSYVKIPVDDQQTVTNVMNLLGQLFKGFGK